MKYYIKQFKNKKEFPEIIFTNEKKAEKLFLKLVGKALKSRCLSGYGQEDNEFWISYSSKKLTKEQVDRMG